MSSVSQATTPDDLPTSALRKHVCPMPCTGDKWVTASAATRHFESRVKEAPTRTCAQLNHPTYKLLDWSPCDGPAIGLADVSDLLRGRKIAFVGDSTVGTYFEALAFEVRARLDADLEFTHVSDAAREEVEECLRGGTRACDEYWGVPDETWASELRNFSLSKHTFTTAMLPTGRSNYTIIEAVIRDYDIAVFNIGLHWELAEGGGPTGRFAADCRLQGALSHAL